MSLQTPNLDAENPILSAESAAVVEKTAALDKTGAVVESAGVVIGADANSDLAAAEVAADLIVGGEMVVLQ